MKITTENHDGRLRLRWLYQGKRYTLGCGVPATSTGRAIAKQKAAQIELDISAGYFDLTLLKYKPRTIGKTATEISTAELFQRFSEHQLKEKGLARSSIDARYKPIESALKKWLDKPAHDVGVKQAKDFAAILTETVTAQTARARLWLLQSCWDWAKERYHVALENPWAGLGSKIKPQPTQRVKPFTSAEILAILGAFRTSQYYSHYVDFVTFLFGTGVRFGEAAGLKWSHVADDFQTVWIGESVSRGHRKSTKTGKCRTLVLSSTVAQMLRDRHNALKPKPDHLVFPSPKGLSINDRAFRVRAWKAILEQCHVEYRKPYAVRHSAISHALSNGANPMDLAEQTGHDKRVLLSTYAHAITKKSLFVEF
jgi:integrase